jgi:hypothetical protein
MAADSNGTFSVMFFVSLLEMSTSRGKTWLYPGINNTSSNVRPSPKNLLLELWDLLSEAGFLRGREDFISAMCKDIGFGVWKKSRGEELLTS